MIKYSNSQIMRRAYFAHKKSNIWDLYNVYKKPSWQKENTFKEIIKMSNKLNGYNLKIIAYNTFSFTAGFLYDDVDRYGDVIDTYFVYVTPTKWRKISINETL